MTFELDLRSTTSSKAKQRWKILQTHVKRGILGLMLRHEQMHDNVYDTLDKTWDVLVKVSGLNKPKVKQTSIITPSLKSIQKKKPLDSSKQQSIQDPNCEEKNSNSNSILNEEIKLSALTINHETLFNPDKLILDKLPLLNIAGIMDGLIRIIKSAHNSELALNVPKSKIQLSWTIIIAGLFQSDSADRSFILLALQSLAECVPTTTYDSRIKDSLMYTLEGIMVSDESLQNRVMAVFLIGEMAIHLGPHSENDMLLSKTFQFIAKTYWEINYESQQLLKENEPLLIILSASLGKHIRHNTHCKDNYSDFFLLLMHSNIISLSQDSGISSGDTLVHSIEMINSIFEVNQITMQYIGALFESYLNSWMQSSDQTIKNCAIDFASKWLPIMRDDGFLIGLNILDNGLVIARDILGAKHAARIDGQKIGIENEKFKMEVNVNLRRYLMRQIIQYPGTFASLQAVPHYKHVFATQMCGLLNTKCVIALLPSSSDCRVLITRVMPPIPGVPSGCTTSAPPLLIDDQDLMKSCLSNSNKISKSVPFGYSRPNVVESGLQSTIVKSGIPLGFLRECYYANYDKKSNNSQTKSAIRNQETLGPLIDIPFGLSSEQYPILWPNAKNNTLNMIERIVDFPLHCRVVIDIISEKTTLTKRLLAKVVAINSKISALGIYGESTDYFNGKIIEFHVENDHDDSWDIISLEIINCQWEDEMLLSSSRMVQGRPKTALSMKLQPSIVDEINTSGAIPAGFNTNGEAYFAPPINVPPVPVAFTPDGIPMFGKSYSIHESSFALLKSYKIAGFDIRGEPFVVTPGCKLPSPIGFTTDGIPYYDIQSIMCSKQMICLSDSITQQFNNDLEFSNQLVQGYLLKLDLIQPNALENQHYSLKTLNFDSDKKVNRGDIQFFLKSSTSALSQKENIKFSYDFDELKFQSLSASVSKSFAIKYNTGRNDDSQHKIFISAEPTESLQLSTTSFEIKGNSSFEISLNFDPSKMKSENELGSLCIINNRGMKLLSIPIIIEKKSFIAASHRLIDFGWLISGTKKTLEFTLENQRDAVTQLRIFNKEATATQSPFTLPEISIKLSPFETKKLYIHFEPQTAGHYNDEFICYGPGGEVISIKIEGICGSPIIILPESNDSIFNSRELPALERERTQLMKKLYGSDVQFDTFNLSEKEKKISSYIQNFMAQFKRDDCASLDFGIFYPTTLSNSKFVTLLNQSNFPISVATHPRNSNLSCNYLVCVPPKSAIVTEIVLFQPTQLGHFTSTIDFLSAESIPFTLGIVAHNGCPISILATEFVFFRPILPFESEVLEILVSNTSHYDIDFSINCTENAVEDAMFSKNVFVSSRAILRAHSVINLSVEFIPDSTGIFLHDCSVRIYTNDDYMDYQPDISCKFIGICFDTSVTGMAQIDGIKLWLSHPRRIVDQYPGSKARFEFPPTILPNSPNVKFISNARQCSVISLPDSPAVEISNDNVQNKSALATNVLFISSTGLFIEPSKAEIDPHERFQISVFHQGSSEKCIRKPFSINGYAFVLAYENEKRFDSMKILLNFGDGISIHPAMEADGKISLDFDNLDYTPNAVKKGITRVILVTNTTTSLTYSWEIVASDKKKKWSAFTFAKTSGALHPLKAIMIPVKFFSDMGGMFDGLFHLKLTSDGGEKIQLSIPITMKGNCFVNNINIQPETINFGTISVNTTATKTVKLQNMGTKALEIRVACEMPMVCSTKDSTIEPGKFKIFNILFQPKTSCELQSKVIFFAENQVYEVFAVGKSGTLKLELESRFQQGLDFGPQQENSIISSSVYMKNTGTLPLKLQSILCKSSALIRCQLVDVVKSTPSDIEKQKLIVKRDYWRLLQSKLAKIIQLQHSSEQFVAPESRIKLERNIVASNLEIIQEMDTSFNLSEMPQLESMHSYHFQLSYVNRHPIPKNTMISFLYKSDANGSIDEDGDVADTQELHFKLSGSLYRAVELNLKSIDFGITPIFNSAENMILLKNQYIQSSSPSARTFQLVNLSREYQVVSMDTISYPFALRGSRKWELAPGDRIDAIIDFEPPQEQIRYKGQAKFTHKYGSFDLFLSGIGAAAKILSPDDIQFGYVQFGTSVDKSFALTNSGLLESRILIDLIQEGTDFRFSDEIAMEVIIIKPGCTRKMRVTCDCLSISENPVSVSLKWQQTSNSNFIEKSIPICIEIGKPLFKLDIVALDFGLVFVNQQKQCSFDLINDGDVDCNWSVTWDNPFLQVPFVTGQVQRKGKCKFLVQFTPTKVDSFFGTLTFSTDAGYRTLSCYGITGVPFIKFEETLDADLGICEVDVACSYSLHFINTCKHAVKLNVSVNDSAFSVFTDSKSLEFNERGVIVFQILPSEYKKCYKTEFRIRTSDGEEHSGSLSLVGGKSILSLVWDDDTVLEEYQRTNKSGMEMVDDIRNSMDDILSLSKNLLSHELFQAKGFYKSENDLLLTLTLKPAIDLIKSAHEIRNLQVDNQILDILMNLQMVLTHINDLKGEEKLLLEKFATIIQNIKTYITPPKPINKDSTKVHDFGIALHGSSMNYKFVTLQNSGNMPFAYTIERVNNVESKACVFKVDHKGESILPNESSIICVLFDASTLGVFNQTFLISSMAKIITKINVQGQCAKPQLSIDSQEIQFGNVLKSRSSSKSFTLSNLGKCMCRYSIIPENYSDQSNEFEIDSVYGFLQPLQSKVVTCIFSPNSVGEFSKRFIIRENSQSDPMKLLCSGLGGSLKIQVLTRDGRSAGNIEFGSVLIGNDYFDTLCLKNSGSTDVNLIIECSHHAITLDANWNSQHSIYCQAGTTEIITIKYRPVNSEEMETRLKVNLNGSPLFECDLRAMSGKLGFAIDDLKEFSTKAKISSSKTIEVKNTGDFTFKLMIGVSFDPDNNAVTSIIDYVEGVDVDVGQTLSIPLIITGHHEGQVTMNLTYTMQIYDQVTVETKTTPIKFFESLIQIDDNHPIDIGRVLCGSLTNVQRSLINCGDIELEYRIRFIDEIVSTKELKTRKTSIVPKSGKGKQSLSKETSAKKRVPRKSLVAVGLMVDKNSWAICSPLEGIIPKNERVQFELQFNAPIDVGQSKDIYDRKLLIEYKSELSVNDEWSDFLIIDIAAMIGSPDLQVDKNIISFETCGILGKKDEFVTLLNKGLVASPYKVTIISDELNVFFFSEESVTNGVIASGESLVLGISFAPLKECMYESTMSIFWLDHEINIKLNGYGAYKDLERTTLPTSIDFGSLQFGKSNSYEFKVRTEKMLDLTIHAICTKFEMYAFTELVIEEDVYELTQSNNRSTSISLSIHVSYPDSTLAKEIISNLKGSPLSIGEIQLQVVDGPSYIIPLILQLDYMDIVPRFVMEIDASNTIDFGTIAYQKGLEFKMDITNPNTFPVTTRLSNQSQNTRFNVYPECLQLNENETGIILIKLAKVIVDYDDAEVAEREDIAAIFIMDYDVLFLSNYEFKIQGTLQKSFPTVDIVSELEFPIIHENETTFATFTVTNPSRRELNWSILLNSEMEDIFYSQVSSGTILSKGSVDITIHFKPVIANSYYSSLTFTTEFGPSIVELQATCEDINIRFDSSINFGVVDIDFPTFKMISVQNESQAPVHLGVRCSESNISFQPSQIELSGGEVANIQVNYSSRKENDFESGLIELYNISNIDQVLSVCTYEGLRGIFDIVVLKDDTILETEFVEDPVSKIQTPRPSSVLTKASTSDGSIPFTELETGSEIFQSVEIVNDGDTILEYGFVSTRGNSTSATIRSGNVEIKTRPGTVAPRSRKSISISIKGLTQGESTARIYLTSTNLLTPYEIPIDINTKVITRSNNSSNALKSFVEGDTAFMDSFKCTNEIERLVMTDKDIWKVIYPIVRVSDSDSRVGGQYYPSINPMIDDFDLNSLLCRPSAIIPLVAVKIHKPRKYFLARPLPVNKESKPQVSASLVEAMKFYKPFEREVRVDFKY